MSYKKIDTMWVNIFDKQESSNQYNFKGKENNGENNKESVFTFKNHS